MADGDPLAGPPAAMISAAVTACCAGDAPRPPPVTPATMAGPAFDRSAAASALVVMAGPGSRSSRSRRNTGGRPTVDGPARPTLTELPGPCRYVAAAWLIRTGAPGRPATSVSTGARAATVAGRYPA